MDCILDTIKNQDFIGTFTINEETGKFDFITLPKKDLDELGDVIYFFIDNNNKVHKVGKAGGNGGLYSRISAYKYGKLGDNTSKRIHDIIIEKGYDEIHMYALICPRIKFTHCCLFTGEEIELEAPTNVGLEKYYIGLIEKIMELEFCYQKK